MANFLTVEQTKKLIDGRPQGVSPEEILSGLKSRGYIVQGFNEEDAIEQDRQDKDIASKIASFTGGEKLAKGLGTSISNVLGGQEQVQESQAGLAGMQTKVVQEIAKQRALGKDTKKLEKALKKSQSTMEQTSQAVSDVGTQGLTDREVLGSAAQLATNIAGFASPGAASLVGKTGLTGLKAAGAKIAGSAVEAGLTSGLSSGAKAIAEGKTGQEALDIAEKSAKIGALFGAGTQSLGEIYKGLGKLITKTGEKISFSVIKPRQVDTDNGFKVETLKKYNLGGSLDDTLKKTNEKMSELSKTLNSKLSSSNKMIDMNKVFNDTVNELNASKLKGFGANTSKNSAINQLKAELDEISGSGITFMDKNLMSIPDAQVVKQAAGANGAWLYGMKDPDSNAREMVYNAFYTKLKEQIEKSSPEGVREINKQLSELIPVRNAVIRRIPVAERNNILGLGEIIGFVGSVSNPQALAVTAASLASKSGKVGQALTKAGEKMSKTKLPNTTRAIRSLTAPVIADTTND